MGEDSSALLKVYERGIAEKAAMAECVNRIIGFTHGEKFEGTTSQKEFTNFIQHLSNVRSLFSKHDNEMAGAMVEMILSDYSLSRRLGPLFNSRITEELQLILAIPIDLSRLRSKEFKALLQAQGVGAGIEYRR